MDKPDAPVEPPVQTEATLVERPQFTRGLRAEAELLDKRGLHITAQGLRDAADKIEELEARLAGCK